ncbi:MAG: DUF4384 domain-containing protein [Bryobacteraceae bacterium]
MFRLKFAFVCLVALGAGMAEEASVRARELAAMFYTDTLPAPKNVAQKKPAPKAAPQPAPVRRRVGLKYRLQLHDGVLTADVDPSREFRSGDEIRLHVESNIDGYLYIVQKGSSGIAKVLFPAAEINGGSNAVRRGIPYPVPAEGFFQFDQNPGEERLTVIVSRVALESVPQTAPAERLQISLPTLNAELARVVRARDLEFVKETGPVLNNAAPSSQATIWVNTSEERNDAVFADIVLKHR